MEWDTNHTTIPPPTRSYFTEKVRKKFQFRNAGAPGSVTADLPLVMVFSEGQNKLELL